MNGVRTAVASTFSSLRIRNFRLFITGQFLSGIGTWMQMVAAPWLVLQLTGSGVALGIDTALQYAPMLVFGAWGGVIADRFDNRRLQILTQLAYAVTALALWTIVATGVVRIGMVYALSLLTGLVTAVDMPTRQSFYLEMVGRTDLTNAMSLNTATFTGTRIVGAALAGVLIALIGTAPIFLINGITYLAVVVALLRMRVGELNHREPVPRARGQIREGVVHVWRTAELRLPLLLMAAVFVFSFNFSVLLPLFATRTFAGGSQTYGAMLSLWGVGSLAGALVLAGRSADANAHRLSMFGLALGALSLAVSLAPAIPLAYVLLPPLGAVGISFAITGNSTLQLRSAPHMRGRVMALYSVVFLGSTPIGGPLSGWVGQHLGARVGLAGGGAIALAAAGLAASRLRSGSEPKGRSVAAGGYSHR
ncbi:MAG TPA: MFS transporter [Actinomycetota bacterium]|jgi:MFS family permease|nr:MFS transporter [Actinomycetota bacterium]